MRGGLREPGWGLCQSPPELLLLMQLPLWLPHTPQGSPQCLDFTISLPWLLNSGRHTQCLVLAFLWHCDSLHFTFLTGSILSSFSH